MIVNEIFTDSTDDSKLYWVMAMVRVRVRINLLIKQRQ